MKVVADFFIYNSHQPIFCYSSVVVKKTVFENAGYFDETITLGEDVDFNIRANFHYSLAYYNRVCARYNIFSENQITNSSIAGKSITDFNKYEFLARGKPSVKLYLDINRYILAMHYKLSGDNTAFRKLVSEIDNKNLSSKQILLLQSPVFIVKWLRKIKNLFLKKGIRFTSFK